MKTIIIIGASRGIGKEIAIQASKKGNKTIALARNYEKLKLLKRDNPTIKIAKFDLSSDTLKEELKKILQQEKKIDILINNAGYLVNKAFEKLEKQDFINSYKINLIGPMLATQEILKKMKKGSHIVNISSMGGYQGSAKFAGLAAYSSSKAAIASITELLAEEYKETGISFNCLALGAVQTEMLEDAFPGYQAPLKADEMAKYILEFSLNGNQYFNGKIIPVSSSTP